MMSDFRREVRIFWVATQCIVLTHYRWFQDNLSVPSSRVENPRRQDPCNKGPIGCPETLVRNYHYTPHSNPEEHRSQVLM